MPITFTQINDAQPVVDYLYQVLQQKLGSGQRVLWLLTGGSAMGVAVTVAQQLHVQHVPTDQLSISLIDERYGPIGHADSNWQQLADKGFDLPGATLLPVLDGQSLAGTAAAYDAMLHQAFDASDYALGFFGIGPDGHVAGILPGSPALTAGNEQLATGYEDSEITAPPTEGVKRGVARLTITPAAILRLDEAVCLAMGEPKKSAIKQLQQFQQIDNGSGGAPAIDLPASLLANVPKTTVFTDQL
jgi:6-phosphogluconolactonase/glucosamine-6-phosphate isomerase/deaminase